MKCKKTIYLFNLSLEKKQAIKTSDKVNKKTLLNKKSLAKIAAEPIELNRIVSVLLHFLFIYIYLI